MYGKPLRVQMEKKNILHDTTKIKACSKEESTECHCQKRLVRQMNQNSKNMWRPLHLNKKLFVQ